MKKQKKINCLIKFFKSLNSPIVLFGLLTSLGIIIPTFVFLNILNGIINLNKILISNLAIIIQIIFSAGVYYLIGSSKSFKTGYLVGFIMSMIIVINYALLG